MGERDSVSQDLVLIRYVGEIGIKGKNRSFFVKRLRRNLRRALKRSGISGRVWSEGQRICAEIDEEARETALSILQRVFGVASLSPVHRVPSTIDEITAESVNLAEHAGIGQATTFRVKARRADKTFPHISPEIGRLAGAAIQEATGAQVDLSDRADFTVGVEVRGEGTLLYGEVLPGPGGMPIGTQGRVFGLLSGGIDSPVAAWLMMRRGCGVIPLHFSQNEAETSKAMDNCQVLSEWALGWEIKPIVLDHYEMLEPIANRLRQLGHERWTCLFCKRAMIAKAAELAPQYHVQAVVMGDSLGQVASQTIHNLAAISWCAPLPILRPLIAYDKGQIVDQAKHIGTFDVSTRESTGCAFLPDHPVTSAELDDLQAIIAEMD